MEVLEEILKDIDSNKVFSGCETIKYDCFINSWNFRMVAPNEAVFNHLLVDSLGLLACKKNAANLDELMVGNAMTPLIKQYCYNEAIDLALYMKRQILEVIIPHLTHGFYVQFILDQFGEFGRCYLFVHGVNVQERYIYAWIYKPNQKPIVCTVNFDYFTECVKGNIEQPNFKVLAFRLSPDYEKKRTHDNLKDTIRYALNEDMSNEEMIYGIGVYDAICSCINDASDVELFSNQTMLLELMQQRCELLIDCMGLLMNEIRTDCDLQEMATIVQDKTKQLCLIVSKCDSDYNKIKSTLFEIKDAEEKLLLEVKSHLL